jgi:hypothetical protein
MGQYGNQPDFGTRAVAITPKGFAGGSYVNVIYNDSNDEESSLFITSTNLNVSTQQDGTPIPQALSGPEWANNVDNGIPCWAYYGYTEQDTLGFGKIYNYVAASQGPTWLYPDGYSLLREPTASEMTNDNGYNPTLGQELKSIPTGADGQDNTGTSLWDYDPGALPNTDIFNFTGLPGGFIDGYSNATRANVLSYFWTDNTNHGKFWLLGGGSDSTDLTPDLSSYYGGYIRLVVDPTAIEYTAPEPLNSAALYVGTGGDLIVTIVGSETPVMFKNVPDASFLPIIVNNVWETGDMGITTASDIIAIY